MATVEVGELGGTVEVQVGDEVVLRLPENPATGYRWELDAARGALELADDSYVRPRGSAGVGAGGERHFRFRATEAGATRVQLRLARGWETGAPAEEGSVAVTVAAAPATEHPG